jgi:hypothetical protein
MKLELSGMALDTIFLALQGHGAAIQNTMGEIQAQVKEQQKPAPAQQELDLGE